MELAAIYLFIYFNTERNKWAFQQAAFTSVAVVCPPPRKALTLERLGSPAEWERLLTNTNTHTHTNKTLTNTLTNTTHTNKKKKSNTPRSKKQLLEVRARLMWR